jgi:hypothetical protein
MNMMWPPENPDDDNHIMNRLRRMLDILEEDMIADRPEDFDDMADVVVTEVEYEESDVESRTTRQINPVPRPRHNPAIDRRR